MAGATWGLVETTELNALKRAKGKKCRMPNAKVSIDDTESLGTASPASATERRGGCSICGQKS